MKLKEGGEKTLLRITERRFMAAKDLLTSAFLKREDQYKQELDKKENLIGEERVEHLTAVYCNLLAAEDALKELVIRVKALQTLLG